MAPVGGPIKATPAASSSAIACSIRSDQRDRPPGRRRAGSAPGTAEPPRSAFRERSPNRADPGPRDRCSLIRRPGHLLGEAVELACEVLREWGIEPLPRERPVSGTEHIGPVALDMREYELGRPVTEGNPA